MKLLKVISAMLLVPFGIIPDCGRAINTQYARFTKLDEFKVTAYCPCRKCCGKNAKGITASGHQIVKSDKFCAAPLSIPFGKKIEIPGYGRVPVLDRGSKITGNSLDVFFPTHQEAKQWGVKYLKIKME